MALSRPLETKHTRTPTAQPLKTILDTRPPPPPRPPGHHPAARHTSRPGREELEGSRGTEGPAELARRRVAAASRAGAQSRQVCRAQRARPPPNPFAPSRPHWSSDRRRGLASQSGVWAVRCTGWAALRSRSPRAHIASHNVLEPRCAVAPKSCVSRGVSVAPQGTVRMPSK
jgi:hypothetical protein